MCRGEISPPLKNISVKRAETLEEIVKVNNKKK